MCERWIVPRAGTALVAVPDTMRIYRTEVYLLSFVTAPFDASHREARGLSLEERHRHLEHLEDVNDHAHKNYCGRRMIPFVADIVYECATDSGRCILPALVARLFSTEEHTSGLQALMRLSYAAYWLHKNIK